MRQSPRVQRPRSTLAGLSLLGLGVLVGLFAVEVLLQGYFAMVLVPLANRPVADPVVGHRPNPAYREHDSRGWRNDAALPQAKIVVLGDSQTYGYNASIEEAWPQQLGAVMKMPVYQIAYGEYGPAHYLMLIDEALLLKPDVLLAAYYYGNDLYDSYAAIYNRGVWRRSAPSKRLDSLFSIDPKVSQALDDVEASKPAPKSLRCTSRPSFTRSIGSAVGEYSRLIRTVQVLTRRMIAGSRWRNSLHARYDEALCVPFRDGAVRTIFTVQYRLFAMNDRDPRIVEGERLTFLAFKELAERSRRAGARAYVVAIPTKETAFRSRAEASWGGNHPGLTELWSAEARARARAAAFFAQEGIAVIDVLPALASMIAIGMNPYTEGTDAHPRAAGYQIIAQAVASRLIADGLGNGP